MAPLALVLLVLSLAPCSAKLHFVQIIFRGGDRSPTRAYPTDPNRGPDVWPNGWSQLTKKGEEEMLELGTLVRERYIENQTFIDAEFNQDQVYLRTSSKRRATESTRFFAKALFPNQKPPIAANVPYWEDLLLKPSSVHCGRYEVAERELNREFFKELDYTHGRFFGFLSDKTGMEVDMSSIGDVYSAFFREKIHNLPQPEWVNESVFNTVAELKRIQLLSQYNHPVLSKLRSGYLLGDIVKNIVESHERSKLPKCRIYSSHDDTMVALMYNMGILNEQLLIPYASMLVLERHQDNAGHHFVRVFFREGTGAPLEQLSIPGCLFVDCPYSLFKALMEHRSFPTKNDAIDACGVPSNGEKEDDESGDHTTQEDPLVKEAISGKGERTEGTMTLVLMVTVAVLGSVVFLQSICLFRAMGREAYC